MSKVRKLLLRTGVYQAPQGELVADLPRLRRWADTFRKMKSQGIRIPACWGHQPEAVPCPESDRASKQYWLSRFNAGYVEDLDVDDEGNLTAVIDAPGCELDPRGNLTAWTRLPDGREVRTAVGEVSAAVRDWTDGTGRTWPDSLIHVAITPLPVVAGQGGFRALSALDPAPAAGRTFYLSLAHLLSTEATGMADDITAPAEGAGEGGQNAHFEQALKILEKMGLNLPPDTTPENLYERIAVAGHAMGHAEPDGDEALPPEEGDGDGDETGGEDADGVSYSGDEGGMTEEPRPVMMSLSTAKTPAEKALIRKRQEDHLGGLRSRIDRLVKRGLPVARANDLRARLGGYQLSLTSSGEVAPRTLDRELAIWDEALPKKRFSERYLSTHGTQEPRPGTARAAVSDKELDALAESVSTPSRRR